MRQSHATDRVDNMADFPHPEMTVLTEDECWRLMARTEVGRLAVCIGTGPEIFPVNFVTDNRTVLIRTAEGTKLAAVSVNPQVAFEADGFDPVRGDAWSVIVRGTTRVLEKLNEVYAAQELPLVPWDATPKPIFVRIEPETISGRRFAAARGLREP
jgi:nitroimidazol reductase NimA-like FMN-containing flavoprotein (pyridoxamine 5'-phosphate oxidase superfamily)